MMTISEKPSVPARVTVGIPAYNGARTLRRAVESVLCQTHGPCLVHISDDASTDATAEVGRALAAEYPNVTYTRQPTNLNHHGNFRFVLQQAQSAYFMWLADDDYLEPTYVERALAVLEADPTVVTCVSRVRFVRPDGATRLALGTYPLMADRVTNIARYLSNPNDNSRLFGLHRIGPLRKVFPKEDFLISYDWATMAGTLMHGKHAEIPDVLLIRDETPFSAYLDMIREHAGSPLARWFPALRMTKYMMQHYDIPLQIPILKAILGINLLMHIEYMRAIHPRYRPIIIFLERNIIWRLRTL